MSLPPSYFPRPATRKSTVKRPDVHRNQQAAVFCHLGRILWQLSRRIPWSRLTDDERSAVRDAAKRIAIAAETAKAASGRG